MTFFAALLLSASLTHSSASSAAASADLARMGQATWSAFECTALAAALENEPEQRRLLKYGVDTGRVFLEALRGGKIGKKDIDSAIPIGVLWAAEGPSADFALGRIYESAADEALKDLFAKGERTFSKDEVQLEARSRFDSRNCPLIGR